MEPKRGQERELEALEKQARNRVINDAALRWRRVLDRLEAFHARLN